MVKKLKFMIEKWNTLLYNNSASFILADALPCSHQEMRYHSWKEKSEPYPEAFAAPLFVRAMIWQRS
jgi:hypothetical protein